MITGSLSLPFSFFPHCQLLRSIYLYFHVFPPGVWEPGTGYFKWRGCSQAITFLSIHLHFLLDGPVYVRNSKGKFSLFAYQAHPLCLLFNHLNQPLTITALLHSHMPDSPKNPHTCKMQWCPGVRSHSILFLLHLNLYITKQENLLLWFRRELLTKHHGPTCNFPLSCLHKYSYPQELHQYKNFFLWFQEFKDLLDEDKLCGVPVLVFANKQDLLNAKSPAEVR